jgi:hypothetical protein
MYEIQIQNRIEVYCWIRIRIETYPNTSSYQHVLKLTVLKGFANIGGGRILQAYPFKISQL